MTNSSANWKLLPPEQNEVHVWSIDLSARFPIGRECETLLSPDEHDRASRFVFDLDRHEYIKSHAAIRLLLEAYGVAPADQILFRTSPQGKPELDPEHHSAHLEFNLSHTRGIAVCAFANNRAVGIDVELLRTVDDADGIVRRYFSSEEQAEYAALAAPLRQRAFLNAWTRKEAFLKSLGTGLGGDLASFAVTLEPAKPTRIVHVQGCPLEAAEWTLKDLSTDETIIALAVRGTDLRIVQRSFPDGNAPAAGPF